MNKRYRMLKEGRVWTEINSEREYCKEREEDGAFKDRRRGDEGREGVDKEMRRWESTLTLTAEVRGDDEVDCYLSLA